MKRLIAVLAPSLILAIAAPARALEPAQVLVVANAKVEGSLELARDYARLRGIPEGNVVSVEASDQEEISRADFDASLRDPLAAIVKERPNILALVPVFGVPLKVKETDRKNDAKVKEGFFKGRDFACVDSDLALLRRPGHPIEATVNNPYYDRKEPLSPELKLLIVTRLDGSSLALARGLIEKALLAEAFGPSGQSFLDTRGPNLKGGYKVRDDIMQQVGAAWEKGAIPFDHDVAPKVVDLSTRASLLHYYGWYAGTQKPAGRVRFRTGAIAVHLHSFSAGTIRKQARWVGPLLNWGCTATYGTVYEPLTLGFPYENIFWDRLVSGFSFGEAAQMSNRLLSWQSVFVGDPLYNPYREGFQDKNARNRAALIALSKDPEATIPAGAEAALVRACKTLIDRRLAAIDKAFSSKRQRGRGVAAVLDLRFLLDGFGLEPALAAADEKLSASLEGRLKAMEARAKKALTDTAELEAALLDWKGLPIYKDLEALRDDLTRRQIKSAARLLKKAKKPARSPRSALAAWVNAARVLQHRLAKDQAAEAASIHETIKSNKEAFDAITKLAQAKLEPLRKKAARYQKKSPDKARGLAEPAVALYPDCAARKALKKMLDELDKGEG